MIQFSHFHTGGFVLHRVTVGQSTYSAWFDRSGRLRDAERSNRFGQPTVAVSSRSIHLRAALERIGARYVSEANRLADLSHPAGPLANEFAPVS